MAQISARTGFVAWSSDPQFDLDTPGQWEVARVSEWSFEMMHSGVGEFYIDVGPGEIVRADPRLAGLHSPGQSALDGWNWAPPHEICAAELRGACSGGTPWMLVPDHFRRCCFGRLEAESSGGMVSRGHVRGRTALGPLFRSSYLQDRRWFSTSASSCAPIRDSRCVRRKAPASGSLTTRRFGAQMASKGTEMKFAASMQEGIKTASKRRTNPLNSSPFGGVRFAF